MTVPHAGCTLVFWHAASTGPVIAQVCAGQVAAGLHEDGRYVLEVQAAPMCRLLVDDVELQRSAAGTFAWTPSLYAGRVTLVALEPSGAEHVFVADVSPTPKKLGVEQFDAMLDEIRAFDSTLLLGASAAALEFGRQGRSGSLDSLVQLARMRQHGPGFLAAVRDLSRVPQRFLRPASQALPLSRIRRLHPSAFTDRRLIALAGGFPLDGESLESMQLLSQSPVLTVDTPANRTLFSLLRRFRALVDALTRKTEELAMGADPEEQILRKARRLEVLRSMGAAADILIESPPFTELSRAETTSAGLTQIAAHPSYSRAYRKGTEAMRLAMEGSPAEDMLQVSPTWGVYETWCFLRVVQEIEHRFGSALLQCTPSAASAEIAMGTTLSDGRRLEVLFQATFPSEKPRGGRPAWSLSRERRPDIVITVASGRDQRFLVLDAKYRSGREYVLDAMASAHLYHDALRIDQLPPELCLLLLPGPSRVPSLEQKAFWSAHRVGTLSNFSINAAGVERCAELVDDWINGNPWRP